MLLNVYDTLVPTTSLLNKTCFLLAWGLSENGPLHSKYDENLYRPLLLSEIFAGISLFR